MLSSLLIILSLLASLAAFAIGLVVALLPHGSIVAGVVIAVLAVLIGAGSVQLSRENWGLMRRRRTPPPPAPPRPPQQRSRSPRQAAAGQRKPAARQRRPGQIERKRRRTQRESRVESAGPRDNDAEE